MWVHSTTQITSCRLHWWFAVLGGLSIWVQDESSSTGIRIAACYSTSFLSLIPVVFILSSFMPPKGGDSIAPDTTYFVFALDISTFCILKRTSCVFVVSCAYLVFYFTTSCFLTASFMYLKHTCILGVHISHLSIWSVHTLCLAML